MIVAFEGSCCTDCILYLANGVDDDDTQRAADAIAARWGDDAGHLVASCDEETDEEFSWSACDACGSTLGGARHGCVVLKESV